MISIVEANLQDAQDAQATVRLLNEYALDEIGGGQALSEFAQKNLVLELAKRDSHVILAWRERVAIGLAICLKGFSTFQCKPLLNIHDVIVSRPYRGQGIAQRMLKKAEDIARESDCCKLTLEVLEGNATAQATYRAFGFRGYTLDPRFGQALFWEKAL